MIASRADDSDGGAKYWNITLKEAGAASGSASVSQPAGMHSLATTSRRKPALSRSRSPQIHDPEAHVAPVAYAIESSFASKLLQRRVQTVECDNLMRSL